MPTMGRARSSSENPIALSMERAPARVVPSVMMRLQCFGSINCEASEYRYLRLVFDCSVSKSEAHHYHITALRNFGLELNSRYSQIRHEGESETGNLGEDRNSKCQSQGTAAVAASSSEGR